MSPCSGKLHGRRCDNRFIIDSWQIHLVGFAAHRLRPALPAHRLIPGTPSLAGPTSWSTFAECASSNLSVAGQADAGERRGGLATAARCERAFGCWLADKSICVILPHPAQALACFVNCERRTSASWAKQQQAITARLPDVIR